jgi:hypothetical protein
MQDLPIISNEPDFSMRERAVLILLILIIAGLIAMVGIPSYSFEVEGDTNYYHLTDLHTSSILGRTTYSLGFGYFSPDQGVSWNFIQIGGSSIEYQVEVVGSDGTIFYDATRNTDFSSVTFPDHASNLTLMITPLCQPCSLSGYYEGEYTYFSRTPFYEINTIFRSFVAAIALVLSARIAKHNYPIIHLILMIAPPVALVSAAWYLYAFDIGGIGVSISILAGSILYAAGSLREMLKK